MDSKVDKAKIDSLVNKLKQKLVGDDSKIFNSRYVCSCYDSVYYNNLNSIKNYFIYSCYGVIVLSIAIVYFLNKTTGLKMILNALYNVFVILLFEFIFINIISANHISIDVVESKKMIYEFIMGEFLECLPPGSELGSNDDSDKELCCSNQIVPNQKNADAWMYMCK